MSTTRASFRSAVFLAVAGLVAACGPKPDAQDASNNVPSAGKTGPPPAVPTWVGTYDNDQKAVLSLPLETKVERPARPVYPVLSRFTFTGEGPVLVPDDLLAYANLASEALAASPFLYVMRSGPPSLANVRALYGPAPEPNPDPWRRVVVDATQRPSLVASLPSDEVRALLDQASKTSPPENLALLEQAAKKATDVPGVQAMLADAALAAGDLSVADSAARSALAIDPSFPHAFRVLAEVALRNNDKPRAKEAIARALAWYPTYPRAWKVAEAIAGQPLERTVRVDQPFIAVNEAGAVVVVTCDRPFCSGYAACKAAFRYEPVFRASVLQEPDSEPYHLSGTEEVVCLEAGLGAHIDAHDRATPEAPAAPDPTAELLIGLAGETGLTGYAMFEVLGQHRPEWLRVAPRPVHDAVLQYIMLRVLGGPVPPAAAPAEPGVGPVTAGLVNGLGGTAKQVSTHRDARLGRGSWWTSDG